MCYLSHCVCSHLLLQQQEPNIRGVRGRVAQTLILEQRHFFLGDSDIRRMAAVVLRPSDTNSEMLSIPTPHPHLLGLWEQKCPLVLGFLQFPKAEDQPKAAMEKRLESRRDPNPSMARGTGVKRGLGSQAMGLPRHPCQTGSCI